MNNKQLDGNSSKNIFFNNEAYFTLSGYFRVCSSENPQVIEEKPLQSEKATVWYALWSEGVIGPYFFENDDRTTVNINLERYGHMPAIEENELENI